MNLKARIHNAQKNNSEPEPEPAFFYDARGTGIDRQVGTAPGVPNILRPNFVTVDQITLGQSHHPATKNVDKKN